MRSDEQRVQRSRVASAIARLWGVSRVEENRAVIESAASALASLDHQRPAATAQLDDGDDDDA